MEELQGGHAIAKTLKANGIECVFGIPGSHILSIYDGIIDDPGIRPITVRHEQGAAFMADGYARVSGKPGVVLVTAGPGVLNAMTGLLEAYQSSSPVMIICGEVPLEHLGKGWGALHELENQTGILESVTKWRKCVTVPEEIPEAVQEGFRQLSTGCPKPVAISIPHDILDSKAEVAIPTSAPEMERPRAPQEQAKQMVDILVESSAPIIFTGWGSARSGAGDEIAELSDILQCPIVTTDRGKGAVSDDHPNVLGPLSAGGSVLGIFGAADLVLALGTRFDERSSFQWKLRLTDECPLVHVDIDESQIDKVYKTKLGVVGDVRTVINQVLEEVRSRNFDPRPNRAAEFADIKKGPREFRSDTKGIAYIEALSDCLPSNTVSLADTTLVSTWTDRYLPTRRRCSYLTPDGSTTMGFAVPAAIGAKLAAPDRPVVVFCGDGGFMFTAPELATAVQNGVDIKVVIFNDEGYGWIRLMQDYYFARRIEDSLVNPDFIKFAESFGVSGARVDSPEGLSSALASALKTDSPAVIEVRDTLGSPY